MSNKICCDIIALLEKKGAVPKGSDQESWNYHYLDAGHVDSINVIQFILEIEEKFGITLTPEDTSSDEFGNIKGLVEIVARKLKSASDPAST